MSPSSLLRQKDFKFKASLGYSNQNKPKQIKTKEHLLFDGFVLLNPILYHLLPLCLLHQGAGKCPALRDLSK